MTYATHALTEAGEHGRAAPPPSALKLLVYEALSD
jgi:hypothetical protein